MSAQIDCRHLQRIGFRCGPASQSIETPRTRSRFFTSFRTRVASESGARNASQRAERPLLLLFSRASPAPEWETLHELPRECEGRRASRVFLRRRPNPSGPRERSPVMSFLKSGRVSRAPHFLPVARAQAPGTPARRAHAESDNNNTFFVSRSRQGFLWAGARAALSMKLPA